MMSEKPPDRKCEIEREVGDGCVGIEPLRLCLAGNRRRGEDDGSVRPEPLERIDYTPGGQRLTDGNRMDPDVVLPLKGMIDTQPRRKIREVFAPQDSGHDEERKAENEHEVEQTLVEKKHGARMIPRAADAAAKRPRKVVTLHARFVRQAPNDQ